MSSLHKKKTVRKKKKRITPSERAKIALDQAAQRLRFDEEKFHDFTDRLHKWLVNNHAAVCQFIKLLDTEGTGALGVDRLKDGLLDMHIPCTAAELHLLCQLLDRDGTGLVHYMTISAGLAFVRDIEATYREEDMHPLLQPTPQHNKGKPVVWDGESYKQQHPRYLKISFRMLMFDSHRRHAGHFVEVVPSHYSTQHISSLIQQHTGIQANTIVLFTDKSGDAQAILPATLTLEGCGFIGGPTNGPRDLTLFYDYSIENVGRSAMKDCPLLLCDYYFMKEKRKLGSASART